LFFIGICPQILLHNLLHNPLLSLHWNVLVCNRMSSYVCIYMYESIHVYIYITIQMGTKSIEIQFLACTVLKVFAAILSTS
jgi:hypothetical protein